MEIIYEVMLNDKDTLMLTEEEMGNYQAELSDGSLVVIAIHDPSDYEDYPRGI